MESMVASMVEHGWHGFVKSFGMILASEIGDKTFFIAAIMAMRHSRWVVFAGAIGALAVMTVLSAALGWAAPNLIPKVYTHYAAIALFLFFGLKSLHAGFVGGSEEEESELEQVEQELGHKSEKNLKDAEKEHKQKLSWVTRSLSVVFSRIFLRAFTMTFIAEWGDRSQISTIGLAAAENVYMVTVGGILGHMVCTGAAVLGGRHLAANINETAVHLVGGVLFLVFAAHSWWEGPDGM